MNEKKTLLKTRSSAIMICLSFVLLFVFSLVGCTYRADNTPPSSTDSSSESVESSSQADKGTKTEKSTKAKEIDITISGAGDCTLGRHRTSPYASSFDAFYDQNGAEYFLKNVKPIFDKDDMTIVNFEGTLTDSETPAVKQFNFKGRDEYLNVLTSGGVDFMSFANNHMYDYLEQGCQDTINVFKENGVPYASLDEVGTYEVKGVTLGMVSVHGDIESEEADMIENGIQKLKKKDVDIIIVNIHTGIEKDHYPSSKQKNLAYCAVDAGADLVLLHHPHVIQGVEFYKGVYIAYSLGNFCFGGHRNPSDKDTIIVQKTFHMEDGKLQRDDELQVVPCSISSTPAYNNYQPTVLEGADKERVIRRMNQYSEGLGVSFDDEGYASSGEE